MLVAVTLQAQLPTATLNGTVADPQGAVVSGAKLTLTHPATGASRETATSSDGGYVFTNLAAGTYTLRIAAQGFATQDVKDIGLEVGRADTLNVSLKVASGGEVITVTSNEAAVELTQSQVAGHIGASTVQNIPLNGRNFLELAFLIPGHRPATNFDPTKTNTLEVSSAGAFGRGGNLTVDGGDNNDEVVGGTLMNFPQDAVQEFQIVTNRFTAEVGRSGSSIINIITKSGTNDYHGSAFFFFRHKELQAQPALIRRADPDAPAAPFDREQYGGSIGGPIVKDKAFWFFALENRNQDHNVLVGERNFTTSSVDPTSAPAFIDDFLLNGRTDFKVTDNDNLFVRYAFQRESDVDNGSLRVAQGSAANRQLSKNRYHSLVADWAHTLSPKTVNSVMFQANFFKNEIPAFDPDDPITNPAGLATGNEIRFPSLQDGANFRIPQGVKMNRYQVRDTFSWTKGSHTLRFGGEIQNFGNDAIFDLFGSGTIFTTEDFATQNRNGDLVTDDRDIVIALALRSAAPERPPFVDFYRNTYLAFYVQDDWKVLPNLTLNLGLRWEWDNNIFAEGDVHKPCADPAVFDPNERCVWIRNVLGEHDEPANSKNFGPRVGFAWDPFSRGKTVIRGGYGIYYDRVVTEVPLLELLLDGRKLPLEALNGSTLDGAGNFIPDATTGQVVNLENPFGGGGTVFGVGINFIDNNLRHPYVQQFTLGLQQQFGDNWVLSADAVHNFGNRLVWGRLLRSTTSTSPQIVCTDGIAPCTITDPSNGRSDVVFNIESTAKSWYSGLLASLQRRPTSFGRFRLGFNANYTLSKTLNYSNDDQIPFNGAEDQVSLVLGINDPRIEKGYAPTDERHRFTFHGTLEMPWQISVAPIWTWSSSVPLNTFVPALTSRLPNTRRNAVGREIKTVAQLNAAIQACEASGICPDLLEVGPNAELGDSFNSLDLRLTKTFTFAERHRLQLIGEVFNLFNITNIRGFNNNNFSGINNAIVGADPLNPTVQCCSPLGTPFRTAGGFFGSGGPRAFQFAVKYSF
ncbi:MAG: TonB-dependent receptor [Terriglobales bacterium]